MRARLGEEMYIVHFQKPGEADAALAPDVGKTMGFFLRRRCRATGAGRRRHAPPSASRAIRRCSRW